MDAEILWGSKLRVWMSAKGSNTWAKHSMSRWHHSISHVNRNSMVNIRWHIRVLYARRCHHWGKLKEIWHVGKALAVLKPLATVLVLHKCTWMRPVVRWFQFRDKSGVNLGEWYLRITLGISFCTFLLAPPSGSSLGSIRAIHLWAKSGVAHSSSVAVGNFEILCNFVPVNLLQDMKVQSADLYYVK